MKNIMLFCIPAHGHTNPMIPVAKELVNLGNNVRFYSFDQFKDKIEASGAQFISCDKYLSELTKEEEARLKKVSTTEMTIQAIHGTMTLNDFIEKEVEEFKPDVVYSDSVCFWGKLTAWKYSIPLVVSTSTFAFNQLSSGYMKQSFSEMCDMIFGLSKIKKELKKLEAYGYKVKSALSLVASDNNTDTVVYATKKYQPYSKSFSDKYLFAGPSVFAECEPDKDSHRPIVYISMGTVLNERPDFYNKCINALKDLDVEVIISCGSAIEPEDVLKQFRNESAEDKIYGEASESEGTDGASWKNIRVYKNVKQLAVLAKANAFISHCGMNSVSESLYMGTPIALFPQTGEQEAVARRAYEMGAGIYLKNDSIENIKTTIESLIGNKDYAKKAMECRDDFVNAPHAKGAAEFIVSAPHSYEGLDPLSKLNLKTGKYTGLYWLIIIAIIVALSFAGVKHGWLVGLIGGIFGGRFNKLILNKEYEKL